jgi:SAM-dependent methyltransferase
VENETATLQNLARVLKPGGTLVASIVNPYYGYPIGEWKRGIWGRLLGRKPHLRLAREYNELAKNARPNFEWRPHLGSNFTPLSHHMRAAREAGFVLTDLIDITSAEDSRDYNLTYQLHRFPIILLLTFTKQM